MILPFRYFVRTAASFVIIAATFTGAYQFHVKMTENYTSFRDKSALYGRDLEEGEQPSW